MNKISDIMVKPVPVQSHILEWLSWLDHLMPANIQDATLNRSIDVLCGTDRHLLEHRIGLSDILYTVMPK